MAHTLPRWPDGNGEMAGRIRAHAWATTPLGAIEGWPQSLRTVVDLVLAMPGPATILWGPRHIQIYNDAYVAIARDRHPALLGRPVAEGWPDAYETVIAPLLDSVGAGRATRLVGFSLRLDGPDGVSAPRAFDTDWSPIRDETGAVAGALQTLVEATDRLTAQTAMRESEARHRLLIGSWAQAMWETDSRGHVIADSPSWRAYTGQTLEAWLGYGWLDAIHPDDRAYAERQWRDAVAARGLVDAEFRLRAPGGSWRWTNVRAAPVLGAGGEIEKWAGMNIDIDARRQAEAALRESEERFAQFAASSSGGLWIRDAATLAMEYTSPAIETIHGIAPDAILGDMRLWIDLIVPEDRETAIDHIEQARSGASQTHEFRIRRPSDGALRWIRNTGFPLRDQHGRIQRIGGLAEDVTEARELRERQAVLVAELQHRTRNLIGVVRFMADKTLRRSADLADFRARYGDRLAALARVQGLLSRLDEGQQITFNELIHAEMAALGGTADRAILTGPKDVALRSSTVQTFALALHELATNAVKYGAFAQPQGRLEVRWRVEHVERDARPWLHVDWRERRVAMPVGNAAAQGGGSGRELIERALPHQLGARTTYVMEADGVHCTIAMPVSERQAARPLADA